MIAVIIVAGEWFVLLRRFCKRRMVQTACFRIGQGVGRQSAYTSASTHTCHCLCSLFTIGKLTTRRPNRPPFIYHSSLFTIIGIFSAEDVYLRNISVQQFNPSSIESNGNHNKLVQVMSFQLVNAKQNIGL